MRPYTKIAFILSFAFGATAQNKSSAIKPEANPISNMKSQSRTITGVLSGKTIHLPDINSSSSGSVVPERFHKDGKPLLDFMGTTTGPFPNVRSFKRKFGLLIPATNTTMEHELWSIIFSNQKNGLEGVGLHVSNIITPKVQVTTDADLEIFKNQFIAGLQSAIEISALAQPEYLIMGMSLEHILYGLDEIKSLMNKIESQSPYSWATWHDAADAALKKYKAKRIALISPFIPKGNENAIKMFEDMGYEVVATFGFSCGNLNDIAHIPDSAKEEAILKFLATPENRLDAVVQLGTNMSMNNVIEKLEPKIGIPILGINAVSFWYALRENGFTSPLVNGGRLLREF